MTEFHVGIIDTEACIGDIIQVEKGGYLGGQGTLNWEEVPSIKKAQCVPRTLATKVEGDYRYREEVKVKIEFADRPIRLPYLLQGDDVLLIIRIQKMSDIERRLHDVNGLMEMFESTDFDIKLLILHPSSLTPIEISKWQQLWPIQHYDVPYRV